MSDKELINSIKEYVDWAYDTNIAKLTYDEINNFYDLVMRQQKQLDNYSHNVRNMSKDFIEQQKIINRQQAEIERLRKAINDMTVNVVKINEHLPLLVAEAIKEHKEQLIFEIVNTPTKKQNCGVFYLNGVADRQLEIIDIIKGCEGKEMVGDDK